MSNIIKVRAIKKYHDAKGILIGYTIQDESGKQMNVHKDDLKRAVANGQVECVNMTLTSDGRLIGKAAPAPKKRQRKQSGILVKSLITNGKKLGGIMIDMTGHNQMIGIGATQYEKMPLNISFDTGLEGTNNLNKGWYDNAGMSAEGKIEYADGVKKVSYSKIKPKLLEILKANNIKFSLRVEKGAEKYKYNVVIDGFDRFSDLDEMIQIIYILIENEMYVGKNKVSYFSNDEGFVEVNCMTGIKDIRAALKDIVVK